MAISITLCLVALEMTSRLYWRLAHGAPFRDPSRILYAWYPELRKVDREPPTHVDEYFDVLFLGGSALTRRWGHIEQELREQLAYEGQRDVRIFNLAVEAHTSRDSRIKYEALGDARFELVVFYHGINEARANNAPPEIFQEDYGHYSWYGIVNHMAAHHRRSRLALPHTADFLVLRARQSLQSERFVPTHRPPEEWLQYGADPKSAAAFEANLKAILDLASERGDGALAMTFATWVPEDYSAVAFEEKELGYGLHLEPLEVWGVGEHVLSTVEVHNAIIRRVAAEREDVLFVDQAKRMAGEPRYFNDPCHLTALGSAKFIENMRVPVLSRVRGWRP